jgi:hypothetical protein
MGVPEDEVGVAVPMRPAIVQQGDWAVGIAALTAFRFGFVAALAIRGRKEDDRSWPQGLLRGAPQPDELHYGFDLGEQGSVSNVTGTQTAILGAMAGVPSGPVMMPGGGGGGGKSFTMNLWVWPLPEAELSAVVKWEERGISETHLDLDAQALRAASTETLVLWNEE